MSFLQKIILISAGDPSSIASEITVKAIQCLLDDTHLKPIVISNLNLIENAKSIVKSDIALNIIKDLKNFSDFKENLSQVLVDKLQPVSAEIKKLLSEESFLDKILLDGCKNANEIASKKIEKIHEIVGF